MDQLLGLSLLRLVDVLTLGRESDLVVVDDRDPHAWCIALDVPYHGRALQDQRVGDNVGWRDGKQNLAARRRSLIYLRRAARH